MHNSREEYAVLARVHYKTENGEELLHFVGVAGYMEGEIDGKKGRWIEIIPSSRSDDASDWFAPNTRPLDTWKKKDGKVYVHEDSLRRVDTVRKQKEAWSDGGIRLRQLEQE